jgi:hypothetical protein
MARPAAAMAWKRRVVIGSTSALAWFPLLRRSRRRGERRCATGGIPLVTAHEGEIGKARHSA